jgi:hypothetical protein
MKIYKNDELIKLKKKKINPENSFYEFDLELKKIHKIPIEMLYINLTYGINKFILNYDISKIKIPQSKIIKIIKKDIYKIIKLKNFKIYFKNFTKCILIKNLIPSKIKYEIKDNIKIFEDDFKIENKDKYIKINTCEKCDLNETCLGILNEYKKFANEEIKNPILLNKSKYENIKNQIMKFKNKEIIKLSKIILNDYKKDIDYLKKIIVFVESFPKNLNDSSIERITYYIYNLEKDWEINKKLINNIFQENNHINKILKYLKKEKGIVISISLMGNKKIRKTLYFTLNNLKDEEIEDIKKDLKLNFKKNYAIGIDFIENELISFKEYNKKEKIKKEEIYNFINDIKIKKKTIEILKLLPENLNQVLLDLKNKKEENMNKKIKRIDISGQYNNLNFKEIIKIIGLNEEFLKNKEIFTFSIELNDKEEKFNFYYSLS